MYKLIKKQEFSIGFEVVQRLSDNAFIPFDPDNTDYQAYLKWVSEGNTPLPADE
jgi:hypothetical protein